MKLHFSAPVFILLTNLFYLNANDDIPNPPLITNTQCNEREAVVTWTSTNENPDKILRYSIQRKNSFTPNVWETIDDAIPASQTTHSVSLPSWGNYTFRVLAMNKIGYSHPSAVSNTCISLSNSLGVPHKNPENVEAQGTLPNNLVIRWDRMPQSEHNGQGFRYNVYWKIDKPELFWESLLVSDWRQNELVINNVPSFQAYRVKVIALNDFGEADIEPHEIIGYSGEDVPVLAPANFRLGQILSPTRTLLQWDSVPESSVMGHFLGYKIRIWNDLNEKLGNGSSSTSHTDLPDTYQEIQIRGGQIINAVVDRFKPNTKNYAQICVYNGKFNGPLSETLSFEMPEGYPGAVSSFSAYPLGPTAFYLQWKDPLEWNGAPVGYNIYYAKLNATQVGKTNAYRNNPIRDLNQLHLVLGGLLRETKYLLYVTSVNKVGESTKYVIEAETITNPPSKPAVPRFLWKDVTLDSKNCTVQITFLPNFYGNPGSDLFYVHYKKKHETNFEMVRSSSETDYTVIDGLEPQQIYQFAVIAADGTYLTPSETQEVLCE